MSLRQKWTVNPWFWARVICWVRGHNMIQVIGLHFTDASGAVCRRCLKEWLTYSVERNYYTSRQSASQGVQK